MTRTARVAIDGPAASGKSAVGSRLARELHYRFVDTGAMYRGITWLALRRGIDANDEEALGTLAETTPIMLRTTPRDADEASSVFVDGEDVTPYLRDAGVEANVSLVSRVPRVRAALVRVQRESAAEGAVVMVGRDIGSIVLPDAEVKVYLDASVAVRARRRAEQMRAAGGTPDVAAIEREIAQRDAIDSSRETSPLTAAPEAVIINTDDLTIEEVVRRIATLVPE